jgi:cystathionine beta-lyase
LSPSVIKFFMSSSFKTFLKHTAKDFHNQSVNPPVVRASTIIFKSMQHIRKTQAKAQKTLLVDIMIMDDKAPLPLISYKRF